MWTHDHRAKLLHYASLLCRRRDINDGGSIVEGNGHEFAYMSDWKFAIA